MTLAGFAVAGVLLFLFLRRLGHGEWPSLLAVALFGLSTPVAEAVKYPFLSEPVTVALEIAFLLALEAGAGLPILALLAVCGALCKDVFLALLPLVFLAARERTGSGRRALGAAAAVAGPALLLSLSLRSWWTPHLATEVPSLSLGVVLAGLKLVLGSWRAWWEDALLWGLTPVAALGALRPQARPFLRRYGYLVLLLAALPFVASVYAGDASAVWFFSRDVPRLLLYVLPLLLPLGLMALDRIWPSQGPPPPPWPAGRGLVFATVATAAIVVLPLVAVDRYRRVDLHGSRDGPLVLALCRETLRFAGRLERGDPASFELARRTFVPGESHPSEMSRMRWFLREGWGDRAHYGTGDAVMRAAEASILIPCLRPRDLDVVLVLEAPGGTRLRAFVNGRPLGSVAVGSERAESTVRVPAAFLFRGDNLLTLAAPAGEEPRARLAALTLRPVR